MSGGRAGSAARRRPGGPAAAASASPRSTPSTVTSPRRRRPARATACSSVDLPAPFGPMTASHDPDADLERRRPFSDRTPAQRARPARSPGRVTSPPASVARSTATKNGAPTNAVTTPMGSSAGAITVRATRSAAPRNAAPPSSDSGSTIRYEPPASRRTTCGTTIPTNPISPLTATAARGRQRGGDQHAQPHPRRRQAEAGRLLVADDSTSSSRPCSSSTTAETAAYGATSAELVPVRRRRRRGSSE